MTKYNREFDEGRKQQGFKSQEHLDAFFRYYDHTCECAECQRPGAPVRIDGFYQPTMNRCSVARQLDAQVWAISDALP